MLMASVSSLIRRLKAYLLRRPAGTRGEQAEELVTWKDIQDCRGTMLKEPLKPRWWELDPRDAKYQEDARKHFDRLIEWVLRDIRGGKA